MSPPPLPSASLARLPEVALADTAGVLRLPALVKGALVYPPPVSFETLSLAAAPVAAARPAAAAGTLGFRLDELQAIREPVLDRASGAATGEWRFLVFPRPDPRALLETDAAELARSLHALPFGDVLDYVAELRRVLADGRERVLDAGRRIQAGSLVDERLLALVFELLPALLDPELVAEAVDRELGGDGRPGRAYLDGWLGVESAAQRGMLARIAEQVFGPAGRGARFVPCVRAVPTRQLHVTAGNSPLVPLLSFLRGLATKGACVVKSPAEACAAAAILAAGMHAVDPDHPITRHTSLLYWPGGDRAIEDVLFAPGAFDRIVVWGSAESVASVKRRAPLVKTVALNPRYGLSLIGREAQAGRLEEAAARASVDTLIWDQKACTASLVHYVEGDEAAALAYCRALQAALARWDERLKRPLPRASLGRLRLLKRGALMQGTWFQNGAGPEITSAVVYAPAPFDLSLHPLSRLVVVRRVDRLEDVVPLVGPAAAAAGVFPDGAVARLRDALAAAGVSNVLPLGEVERSYPGIPHDGMRVLSELVAWTSSGAFEDAGRR